MPVLWCLDKMPSAHSCIYQQVGGTFLTSHRAGVKIVFSYVSSLLNGRWKLDMLSLILNYGDGLALDRRGTYVGIRSWQGHPVISEIAGGCRIWWSWATVTPRPLPPVLRATNHSSAESSTCTLVKITNALEKHLAVDSPYENIWVVVTGA